MQHTKKQGVAASQIVKRCSLSSVSYYDAMQVELLASRSVHDQAGDILQGCISAQGNRRHRSPNDVGIRFAPHDTQRPPRHVSYLVCCAVAHHFLPHLHCAYSHRSYSQSRLRHERHSLARPARLQHHEHRRVPHCQLHGWRPQRHAGSPRDQRRRTDDARFRRRPLQCWAAAAPAASGEGAAKSGHPSWRRWRRPPERVTPARTPIWKPRVKFEDTDLEHVDAYRTHALQAPGVRNGQHITQSLNLKRTARLR